MKASLITGLCKIERIKIDDSNAIAFLGDGLRVYSTPSMIEAVEYACLRLIDTHLDPGETSLGVHVTLDHLNPTPIGHSVAVVVRVRSVTKNKVILDVEVCDAAEVVGRGTHVRVVTRIEQFRSNVAAKCRQLDTVERV